VLLTLWERARIATRRALAKGALGPITTSAYDIADDGARFSVRVVESLEAKERAARARPPGASPFTSPDPDLVIGEVSPAHLLLLNKFPVADDHMLLVTRSFEDQTSLLSRADFDALHACSAGQGAVAFYNAGEIAGASQKHKHIQLVRSSIPLEPQIKSGTLPFAHARADRPSDPNAAHARYLDLLKQIDATSGKAYNLVLTDAWMLAVPRSQDAFEGIAINGLGFIGSILAKSSGELDRIREVGPMAVLKSVVR
jgi:ATP adenylyltransferase